MATDADIEAATLSRLAETGLFACSALKRMNGGTANFVYRGKLLSSHDALQDEKADMVIVKHTTDYVALNRGFKLDRERCVRFNLFYV
jgi:hypothetical protein